MDSGAELFKTGLRWPTVSARFEFRFENLKTISVLILLVYKLMIGSSKNNRGSYLRKCFWTQPSNNWAQIPGTDYQFLSVELGFWIPIVSGIPDSLSCIPDSQAQVFGFHKQKFHGFWNPYSIKWGELLSWSRKRHLTSFWLKLLTGTYWTLPHLGRT